MYSEPFFFLYIEAVYKHACTRTSVRSIMRLKLELSYNSSRNNSSDIRPNLHDPKQLHLCEVALH